MDQPLKPSPERSQALARSPAPKNADDGERIAKVLAHAGVASRREAERMIEDGRVSLNGKILKTPAVKVGPGDDVRVDGKPIAARPPTRLWRHHKPDGKVTTHADPQGRETVFQSLPKELGRVISIGRLDLTSEGLLLLTNDGELARVLELPSTGWTRRYRVRAYGEITEEAIEKLKKGISVEGVKYGPIEVIVDRRTGSNTWLTVGLKEGKNREVRKVLSAVGLTVNRLLRTAYGPFQLGALEKGNTEEIRRSVLREQLGKLYPLDGDGYPMKEGAREADMTGKAVSKPERARPPAPASKGPARPSPGAPRGKSAPGKRPDSKTRKPDAHHRRKP